MGNFENYNFRQEVAQMHIRLLRQQTRQVIASKLDSRKLLFSDDKLFRDWRGLAIKADLDLSVIRSSKISYTELCLHLLSQKEFFVKEFWDALESMDRYDVIDDTLQLIYDDYEYAMNSNSSLLRSIPPPIDDVLSSIADFDSSVLTPDDQENLKSGGSLQIYDALVLFADEDLEFVDIMVQKLEGEYNLKLCLKDRDLLGGLQFEYSAMMRLIKERCARVIVVLSPAFLQSNANTFFTQFAHAVSLEERRRVLIPCMYKPCKKPMEIAFFHSLDYFRTGGYWDYWEKLKDSLEYGKNLRPAIQNSPGPVLREILPPPTVSSALPSRAKSDEESRVAAKEKESRGKDGMDLFVSMPDETLPPENSDLIARSEQSSTSPTLSTAPLLLSPPNQENSSRLSRLRKMARKLKKRKKALAV